MLASSAETFLALVAVSQPKRHKINALARLLSLSLKSDPRQQRNSLLSQYRLSILKRQCARLQDDLSLAIRLLLIWNEGEAIVTAMNRAILRQVETMPTLRGVSWSSDPFFILTSEGVTLNI